MYKIAVMTSSRTLHPLSIVAILLATHFTSSAPTLFSPSSPDGDAPHPTSSTTETGTTEYSAPRPTWHLLLALWRPKGEATPTGAVLPTGQPPPTAHSPPTEQLTPTEQTLTTDQTFSTSHYPTSVGLPSGRYRPTNPLQVKEEVVFTSKLLPTRESVINDSNKSALHNNRAEEHLPQDSGASSPPLYLGVTQYPDIPSTSQDTPTYNTPETLVNYAHSGSPGLMKDKDVIHDYQTQYSESKEHYTSSEPTLPNEHTELHKINKTDQGLEKKASFLGDQTKDSETKSVGKKEDKVEYSLEVSWVDSSKSSHTQSGYTKDFITEEVLTVTSTPSIQTLPLDVHVSDSASITPPQTPHQESAQLTTPEPDHVTSIGQAISPDNQSPDDTIQDHSNASLVGHTTNSSEETSRNLTSVNGSQPLHQHMENKHDHNIEDRRGSKVMEFQGPVVMETLDGASLVPLVGKSKEVLTLKGDGKAILAILQIAQGSNTLEDPFHVTSVIHQNDHVTPAVDQRLGQHTPTAPSFVSDLHSDTHLSQSVGPDRVHKSRSLDGLTLFMKKESKTYDSRKSMNALNTRDKEDPISKTSILQVEQNTVEDNPPIGSTTKPIYEEISGTLQVDTSIDDVEDFDVQIRHTENADDFLPNANQSHPNLIDTDLHRKDLQNPENNSATLDAEPTTDTLTTIEATSQTPSPITSDQTPDWNYTRYPTNTLPSSTRYSSHYPIKTTSDASEPPKDSPKWSVLVSNITNLKNSSFALNESMIHRRPDKTTTEEHYKVVLQERGSLMLQLMDPTADPCEDFYQFACGRWKGKFPIRQDKAVDNTFERLKEDLDDVLRSLLEEPPSSSDNNITKAVKTLYAGCMNADQIEALGASPLQELLKELGGWPVLEGDTWNDSDYDWVKQMADLRNYNNDILISEWVAADITNSSNHIIQLDQPELGLPGREYFINPADYHYREAYLNLMLSVTEFLGADTEVALHDMSDVLHFEQQLSMILTAAEERRNLSAVHKRMTLSDLQLEVPEVDWQNYLETITWGNNQTQEVVVFGLNYFKKLLPLLKDTDNRTISNYLLWRFVKNRISNLGERYIQVKQDYIKVLFGRKTQPERWRSCVTYVSGNLGYVVGAMFVRRYFPETSKHDTDEMIKLIKKSFKTAVNESEWMDAETRAVAQDKVDTIVKNVGYPEYLLNNTYMDEVYAEIPQLNFSADTHFENVLKMLQFHARTNHNLLAMPVNRTAWVTSPAVVNAYYSRSKNMIVFPAGILQPPFYHPAFPRSLNYGGIGVVIGHEITHGFDDRGRQFDKNGNLQQWWKSSDVSQFYQRASCMLDQYGEYKVDELGLKINPVNTLGENIADNAGIKIAYQAYREWGQAHEEQVTVPYMSHLTHDQLFFLNFGQIWCEVNSPEAMLTKIRSGQHSPNKFRVIGTLSNSNEFSEAFNCPVGSRMNPERKCKVW